MKIKLDKLNNKLKNCKGSAKTNKRRSNKYKKNQKKKKNNLKN